MGSYSIFYTKGNLKYYFGFCAGSPRCLLRDSTRIAEVIF